MRIKSVERRCNARTRTMQRLSLVALGSLLTLSTVSGQEATGSLSTAAPAHVATAVHRTAPPKAAKPYAIEFRARNANSYGHTFSIYGRVDARGRLVSPKVSGLHPATESPVPWMIGHLVLVPSETGASDGDTEDQYVLARFRVALSEPEYRKVTGYIKRLSDKSPVWHAVLYNCNAFVGDIAQSMGLKTPTSTMLMPKDYIDQLRELNISRTDLSNVTGTPVKVEDAEALRAAALKALEKQHARAPAKHSAGAAARAATKPASGSTARDSQTSGPASKAM